MTQAADGHPSFAVSIHPGDPGGSPLVEKRGVDARSAELLRHERHVLSRLSHPNIIELAGRSRPTASDESNVLATFLAGRSTLADHPPTDTVAIVRTAAQLATTLAELHDLGWAHGAIAPDHLVVAADGAIVWCSLRRATPISTPDAPAAAADVAALVDVIGRLLPAVPARSGPGRALANLITSARHRTPFARRLADELAGLGRDRAPARRRPAIRTRSPRPPAPSLAPRRPRHARRSPIVGVVVRLVVCLAAVVLLVRLGVSRGPGVGSTDDLAPPLQVAVEIVRWLALVAAAYGAAVNGLTLAALLSRSRRLVNAAGRLGPSVLRRWATGVTSIGVLATTTISLSAPTPSHAAQVVATPPRGDHRPGPTVEPGPRTPPVRSDIGPGSPLTPAPPAPTPAAPTRPTQWVTAPGDDLWHIAQRTLVSAGVAHPTNAQIGRYWQQLMAANRDHLSDPDDPDLIFPGQMFELPPIET